MWNAGGGGLRQLQYINTQMLYSGDSREIAAGTPCQSDLSAWGLVWNTSTKTLEPPAISFMHCRIAPGVVNWLECCAFPCLSHDSGEWRVKLRSWSRHMQPVKQKTMPLAKQNTPLGTLTNGFHLLVIRGSWQRIMRDPGMLRKTNGFASSPPAQVKSIITCVDICFYRVHCVCGPKKRSVWVMQMSVGERGKPKLEAACYPPRVTFDRSDPIFTQPQKKWELNKLL